MNGRPAAAMLAGALFLTTSLGAQEPVTWGADRDPVFHTFSIAAIDTATGEVGVAVTTRVPCVGNGVPWVRAGVGAVATQASTRVEYGPELLEAMTRGAEPDQALRRLLAADTAAELRQVGAISLRGRTAQHTGNRTGQWSGHRAGRTYVTQGNLLVGQQVIDAVATAFQRSEGVARHLGDRLIEAMEAGYAAGGDARRGRLQSAAVIVADRRPGRSRRPDGVTVNINVCEHPQPVAEMRRIYDAISQRLGARTLQLFEGNDVWQLKLMLHALGHYRPGEKELVRGDDAQLYTPEAAAAVDAFRMAERLSTPAIGSPRGLVDEETVARLWSALERAGKAEAIRKVILELTAVRR
ncbi:MAG TPA: DUF1028 domain-containing protein [Gemmatimonadaceae bacterium]|nr:DUF1028 domain-containing protein [Gemmatimonadaceae bacterium]